MNEESQDVLVERLEKFCHWWIQVWKAENLALGAQVVLFFGAILIGVIFFKSFRFLSRRYRGFF